MKILLKIIFIILICLSVFSTNTHMWFADDTENLKTGEGTEKIERKNDYLYDLHNDETDFLVDKEGLWEKWIRNATIRIARDLKNLFLVVAWVYFLIIVLKLLLSSKTEEEISNFKKWIIWISIWIIVTQIAYYFVQILFDKEIWLDLAKSFVKTIIQPLISLLDLK